MNFFLNFVDYFPNLIHFISNDRFLKLPVCLIAAVLPGRGYSHILTVRVCAAVQGTYGFEAVLTRTGYRKHAF